MVACGDSRIAVVTGSSRGIGRAIVARRLDEGWYVIGASRRPARGQPAPHVHFETDLSQPGAASSLVDAIREVVPRVDLLVNNAGAIGTSEAVFEVSEEDIQTSFQLHAMTPFVLTRGLAPELRESDSSSVVNIGSVYGHVVDPEVVAYGSAKCALGYISGVLAAALAPNVRVNCLLPGHVDTALTASAPPEFLSSVLAETALRRIAGTAEVVSVVMFLASAESSFITGAQIPLDGGFRMMV